jgi:tRNA A37 N6-isopentenylltransferase MiaA
VPQPQPRDLLTVQAGALREALAALSDTADPGALAGVRAAYPEADPGLISALATQLRLQRRAEDRLGSWAQEMVLEEEALQQATRRYAKRQITWFRRERCFQTICLDSLPTAQFALDTVLAACRVPHSSF